MEIEFDPAKDAANLAKHGVSLALAERLDWNAALVWLHGGGQVLTCAYRVWPGSAPDLCPLEVDGQVFPFA